MTATPLAKLPRLLDAACRRAWALDFPVLQNMLGIFERHCLGARLDAGEIQSVLAAARRPASSGLSGLSGIKASGPSDRETDPCEPTLIGDTAVIAVCGVVAKYSHMVNDISQPSGVSLDVLGEQLRRAMADRNVARIFLQIESPGGSVDGLADFADLVYEASCQKPVVAFADDLACSAAYWIGSQACEFFANQSALVGSIGVYGLMMDSSQWYDEQGLKIHIVRSGPNKGAGADGVPITDANLLAEQAIVDSYFAAFLTHVLRGRTEAGLTGEQLAAAADGRGIPAAEAMAKNLIDGIGTLQDVFDQVRPAIRPRPASLTNTQPMETPDMFGFLKGKSSASTPKPAEAAVVTTDQAAADSAIAEKAAAEKAAAEKAAAEKAVQADRERVASIAALLEPLAELPGVSELQAKAVAEGLSLEATKAAGYDVLAVAIVQVAEEAGKINGDLQARLDAIATGGADAAVLPAPAAADAEGSDTGADDGKPGTYAAAVAAAVKAGRGKGAAHSAAAASLPKSHAAWIDAGCPEA